jgi:hypothetical protein
MKQELPGLYKIEMAREGTLFMFLILEEKLLTLHLQV